MLKNYCNCGRKCGCNECQRLIELKGEKGDKGDKGEPGVMGATGPQGIQGVPGAKGDRGLMGATGEKGDRGAQGLKGDKGDKGDDGNTPVVSVIGTLTGEEGSFASVTQTFSSTGSDLLFTIPRGNKGDSFKYEDFTPAQLASLKGDKGDKGDKSTPCSVIPFSSDKNFAGVTVKENGTPYYINFLGFGCGSSEQILLKDEDWQAAKISKKEFGNGFGVSFIMPYTARLKKIYAVFVSGGLTTQTNGSITPFVCVATSSATGLYYNILKDTSAKPLPYDKTKIIKADSRIAKRTDLDIEIPEGTLVGIVLGGTGEGLTDVSTLALQIHGSLYFE